MEVIDRLRPSEPLGCAYLMKESLLDFVTIADLIFAMIVVKFARRAGQYWKP